MNRIEELKQHNPHYGKSLIDLLSHLLEKSKYVEMAIRMIKDKNFISTKEHRNEILSILHNSFGIPQEKVNALSEYELLFSYNMLDLIGRDNVANLIKFAEYNERKLIIQSDISLYKNFDELSNQLSLAELKIIDKELQSQVKVLLNEEEWLVLKPLSVNASLKYGASTKWCTAMRNDPEYFARYSKRGILIYCINKVTGYKIAAFKNLDPDYDRETSFWNPQDARIDSMETDLPYYVLSIIRDEFENNKNTNWHLMPQEAKAPFQLSTKSCGDEMMVREEAALVDAVHNLGRPMVDEEAYHGEREISRDDFY